MNAQQTRTIAKNGIVLFAHGSRDLLWSKPIEAIAAALAKREPSAMVRCAYLELMQPDLASVISELADAGVSGIQIAPMFLGVGKHAREDLPELAQELQALYPHITLTLLPSIGEHPALIDCIATILSSTRATSR
jgi:sirohydrochlorin cobaltochelatase